MHLIALYIFCAYIIVSFIFIMNRNYDMTFLSPIRNYKKYKALNWFGIIVMTLLFNIIMFPYANIYWAWRIIKFLFTVGRK